MVATPFPSGTAEPGALHKKQLAVGEHGEQVEAAGKFLLLAREDYRGVGGQGVGVDGGYEDRMGNRLGRGNAAVGSGAQRRPQARSEELFDHLVAGGRTAAAAPKSSASAKPSPSRSMTTDSRARFAPLLMAGNGAGSRGGEAGRPASSCLRRAVARAPRGPPPVPPWSARRPMKSGPTAAAPGKRDGPLRLSDRSRLLLEGRGTFLIANDRRSPICPVSCFRWNVRWFCSRNRIKPYRLRRHRQTVKRDGPGFLGPPCSAANRTPLSRCIFSICPTRKNRVPHGFDRSTQGFPSSVARSLSPRDLSAHRFSQRSAPTPAIPEGQRFVRIPYFQQIAGGCRRNRAVTPHLPRSLIWVPGRETEGSETMSRRIAVTGLGGP